MLRTLSDLISLCFPHYGKRILIANLKRNWDNSLPGNKPLRFPDVVFSSFASLAFSGFFGDLKKSGRACMILPRERRSVITFPHLIPCLWCRADSRCKGKMKAFTYCSLSIPDLSTGTAFLPFFPLSQRDHDSTCSFSGNGSYLVQKTDVWSPSE